MRVPSDMVKGTKFESTNFGSFKILEYTNAKCVLIEFMATGFITTTQSVHIRTGKVKDPYTPNVEGVGYLGRGEYTTAKDKKAYQTWKSMFVRCYSHDYHSSASYEGCTVAREWHCFQDFATWFYSNFIEGYHLDKDIIGTGKEYSPDTCIFVTPEDNYRHAQGTLYTNWTLTNIATGEDITISNQSAFARENGLENSGIGKLCTGVQKTSQGYKLKGN